MKLKLVLVFLAVASQAFCWEAPSSYNRSQTNRKPYRVAYVPKPVLKPRPVMIKQSPKYNLRGYYLRPVDGIITQGLHGRNGIDFRAAIGTPVHAAADGQVTSAGWAGCSGNKISIWHPNGTETVYCHLSQFAVSKGDRVKRGQIIGYTGDTGCVTGPHLHFGVHGAPNPFATESQYASR